MKYLDVNFDIIDKTYEARGEHNIRRWFRVNKAYDVIGSIIPTAHIFMALSGTEQPEDAFVGSLVAIGVIFGSWAIIDIAVSSIKTKLLGLNHQERAYEELIIFSQILSSYGINISVDQMMKAQIYHKNYKLVTEGIPGIIRERYFEVPMTDDVGDEKDFSIKEEHVIGANKYRLSFDKPVEQRRLKLAYKM